jgi:REP element-mobilizing transposase RayT
MGGFWFRNGIDGIYFCRRNRAEHHNCAVTFYRRNLPHLQRDDKPHFITFVTKKRSQLPDWARDIVFHCCIHDHQKKYDLHVAVIMPDHVHLIPTPLIEAAKNRVVPLPEITKAIKSFSAHFINRQSGFRKTIWQEESFDRVLRRSEKLDEKIAYILANPVRGGMVADWREYRWVWYQTAPNRYTPPRPA